MVNRRATFRKGTRKYAYKAYFKQLIPKSEQEKAKWERNRLKAYRGSMRHFFRAMIEHQLEEEGFEIFAVKFFGSTREQEHKIRVSTLLRPSSNPNEWILTIPDYLKIVYKRERDWIKYKIGMLMLERRMLSDFEAAEKARTRVLVESAYQESWIRLIRGKIRLNKNGVVHPDSAGIWVAGYWSWNSPAEWLPIDYEPPNATEVK